MKVPSNKLIHVIKYYSDQLTKVYDELESKSIMYQLVRHFFKYERIDFVKSQEIRLSESELLTVHFAVKELLLNKPLQYVIGETEFLDLRIKVNEHVLIPRPETEELVQLICKREFPKNGVLHILDVGCGSGCIGIALKKNLGSSDVYGLDISENALKLAKENSELNDADLHFILCDILDETKWDDLGTYEMVVSNPPYIRESEKELMRENVLEFEPLHALFVKDDDPLLFYRKIALFCEKHLTKNGILYFEINEALGKETKEMLALMIFKSIEIYKDINGKDRFIRAERI
ncbi:MAG: peptide chain release factor N(5)-glutamine methyltransferase [Bacteroidetes bacterium]|nr:peptide chain release factor N(5)-glutamine methyltransferase [Bacteroidota bacterium]